MLQKKKTKENNPNQPQITYHTCRILITRVPGAGKKNSLFNLISQQPDIDKMCLYDKGSYEAKYQILINKRERTVFQNLKYFNESKAFIE